MTVTAIPSPTGPPAYSETFRCVPQSIADARGLVRIALYTWAFNDLVDDAAVVVSELVTNTVRHTRCREIRVTVTRLAPEHRVRIGVVDRSRKFPVPCKPEPHDMGGRGLAVVEHLTTRWGTDLLPWGKRVWAELGGRVGEQAQSRAEGGRTREALR